MVKHIVIMVVGFLAIGAIGFLTSHKKPNTLLPVEAYEKLSTSYMSKIGLDPVGAACNVGSQENGYVPCDVGTKAGKILLVWCRPEACFIANHD